MSEDITHRITLTLDKGYEFLATFDRWPDLPALRVDEPPPLGEAHGPNPAALLATAVGNCLAASLLFCLRRSRVEVRGLTAHVTVRVARNDKGRLRIGGVGVELVPALASEAAGRLQRCAEMFEDFCVVTESVRHGIPVTVSLAAPPPDD